MASFLSRVRPAARDRLRLKVYTATESARSRPRTKSAMASSA